MTCCEYIDRCRFFRKYRNRSSAAWRGLFATYCRGDLTGFCEHWRRFRQDGPPLEADRMPCGEAVPPAFSALR